MIIFRRIHDMEGKSSIRCLRFFTFTCQLRKNLYWFNFLLENFLEPNWSKIAAECDWISKISQIRAKFWFSEKQMGFSEKNLNFFSQIRKGGKFAIECVSNDIIS